MQQRDSVTGKCVAKAPKNERRLAKRRICQAVAMELAELEPRVLFCANHAPSPLPPVTNWISTFVPNGTVEVNNTTTNGAPVGAGSPLSSVPALNSDPGAPATLYLDFTGAAAQAWGSYNVP